MKAYEKYEVDEMFNNWQEDLKQLTTLNVIPIPDNATNGDVVKAMFPNASFYYHKASDIVDDYVSVCIDDCDTQQDYSRAWWNAPYQKGGKT